MQKLYPAIFEPADEGGFTVTFPDLPGCVTEGDNFAEAFAMALDAAAGWCAAERDAGRTLESPSEIEAVRMNVSRGTDRRLVQLVPVAVPTRKVRVNLTLDDALLIEIDRYGLNRSGFVNNATWQALYQTHSLAGPAEAAEDEEVRDNAMVDYYRAIKQIALADASGDRRERADAAVNFFRAMKRAFDAGAIENAVREHAASTKKSRNNPRTADRDDKRGGTVSDDSNPPKATQSSGKPTHRKWA